MINPNLRKAVLPQPGGVEDSITKPETGQTRACFERDSLSLDDEKTLVDRRINHHRKTKHQKKGARSRQPTVSARKAQATPEHKDLQSKYMRGQNPLDLLLLQDKRDRRKSALDTLRWLEAPKTFPGNFPTPPQSLKKMIRDSIQNTETFGLDHEELFARRDQLLQKVPAQQTRIEVTFETTLQACQRIRAEIGDAPLLCLNFASATRPGGGFEDGANAQEESLARASALHSSLSADPTMYKYNKTSKREDRGFYSDVMIYSPRVPVFKDDTGELIPPYPVSFISAPAINLSNIGKFAADKIQSTRDNRVEKILSIAVARGYPHLILGAWGCGVFRNPPADVANSFARFLRPDKKFGAVFETVTFAMTDLGLCREFDQHLTGE